MPFDYIPLLRKQLEVYSLPRGSERFHSYIQTIVNETGDAVELAPLVAMNPMGKAHCNALLESYLAPDLAAERLAEETLTEFVTNIPLRVSLVLVDDAKGGWTNRTDYEYKLRTQLGKTLQRSGWLSVMLWTSELPTSENIVQSVRIAVRRAQYVLQHGDPKTLREILAQEAATEFSVPELDAEELAYTNHILTPLLETPASNMPVVVAALFGDAAAVGLGYPPLGLSTNAGLILGASERLAHGA